MEIVNTTLSDQDDVFSFFEQSIVYQEKNGHISWRNYDRKAVLRDIENKMQFKIVVNGMTAMVFSVCFSDPLIWRQRDQGDAIFLHRIVVNPLFKGRRLFGTIVEWAVAVAREKQLRFVRMDTWAKNPTIIKYYQTFGFELVELFTTPNTNELPVHNRNLDLALLQLPVLSRE